MFMCRETLCNML